MNRRLISVYEANELAQEANLDNVVESYIKTIQDEYFCLDEDELAQVLNRLIKRNVSIGKRKFFIDTTLLRNEFLRDRKLSAFECDWNSLADKEIEALSDLKFKLKIENRLLGSKHKDSIYAYNKEIGRSASFNRTYVTKISNANRYISLAERLLVNEGYKVDRPYIFNRWSKIIVSLPNPERFRRHIQDSRRK